MRHPRTRHRQPPERPTLDPTVALLLYDRNYHHSGEVLDRHVYGLLSDLRVLAETTSGRKEEDSSGVS